MNAVMLVMAQLPNGSVEFLDWLPFNTMEHCEANVQEILKSWEWVKANVVGMFPDGTVFLAACY